VTHVDERIDPLTSGWDQDIIHVILFWEEDASLILALPMHEDHPNIIAWHYDTNGRFSVRRAYEICQRFAMSSEQY
jgi:hypothetical protein